MARLGPITLWRRFLALPNESIAKTLGVAVLVAIIAAAAVSVTAVSLRPLQEANADRERQERLASVLAGVPGLTRIVEDAGAAVLEARLVDLAAGTYVDGVSAEDYDARSAAADPALSIALPPEADIAGLRRRANLAEVYVVMRDGDLALLILPIYGGGYQSTIYAYLALEPDLQTVAALSVYEQGETPGLGARIQEPAWQDLWPGTAIADETGAIRIAVVRGQGEGLFEVDGITGATRTSSAVSNIVRFWLGDWGYGPFLANLRSTMGIEPTGVPAIPDVQRPELEMVPPPANVLLADRHGLIGIACEGCHRNPALAVGTPLTPDLTTAMCLGCHGTFAEVAARTAAVYPNPHASHLGDLACTSCHQGHQEPVDFCSQCHSFGFVVP